MRRIIILLTMTCATSHARVPNNPLYAFQSWAKSHDQVFTLNSPMSKIRPVTVRTCKNSDMNLEEAWDISIGSSKVVVAIIDNGFRDQHVNYRQNIWKNPGEVGTDENGLDKRSNDVDDDKNGVVDDVHGLNVRGNNGDTNQYAWSVDNNKRGTIEPNWHGESALGIVGAVGDSKIGIAGINWKISMMLLKVSDMNGAGFEDPEFPSSVVKAIRYAVDHGAKVINWSGFLDVKHHKLTEAGRREVAESFKYAESKGVLIVVAAGNSGLNLDTMASKAEFPMDSIDAPNVVYAAASMACGELANYSNYGIHRVKFAAPADQAISSGITSSGHDTWMLARGTSTAAPMVTGVAGLILSVRPDFSYREIKDVLCSSSTKMPALKGKIACGGIVNAGEALKQALHQK